MEPCRWCGRHFQTEHDFAVHVVYGHEAANCPKCGAHRSKKQTLEMSPTKKKGFRNQKINGYFIRTETTYACIKCGFAETAVQISARVQNWKTAKPKETGDGTGTDG